MKSNLQLVILVVFAVATGALGTLLLQSNAAEAQTRESFSECHFIRGDVGWSHMNNPEHLQNPVGRFRVPRGWTVIGPAGSGGHRTLLMCR